MSLDFWRPYNFEQPINPTSVKSPSFSISINALFLTLLSCLILALGSSVRVREREEGFLLPQPKTQIILLTAIEFLFVSFLLLYCTLLL